MNQSILIKIPVNHVVERKYTIDCLFTHILGLPYEVKEWSEDYSEIVSDAKSICFGDHFWNELEQNGYFSAKLPNVTFGKNQFCAESDIPILYGTNKIKITQDSIFCDIDVFASSFFMLSRWEELNNTNVDKHGRYPSEECIAYKTGIIDRPIVNEYAEMIWNMLSFLGSLPERHNKFQLVITHDIDYLSLPNPIKSICWKFASDLIKKKEIKTSFSTFIQSLRHDPFDKFEFFMDYSEKSGIQSHFYFMAASEKVERYSESNYLRRRAFKKNLGKVKKRGHIVGFHPSYFTPFNQVNWESEYIRLKRQTRQLITESRQHFLRFSIKDTLPIWEKFLRIDSSIGFADEVGFRCGTGNRYPLFNFIENRASNVLEQPLIIMDTTMTSYKRLSTKESEVLYKKFIDISYKYSMPLTILFHNSSFYGETWVGWDSLYKNILSYYCQKKHETV